ncbi:Phosphatidylserine decarboxylase proenzyme [Azospirillaceae bacterium]
MQGWNLSRLAIHREGWRFIILFALLTVGACWLWQPLWLPGTIVTIGCAYFFRDPPRVPPPRPGLVLSPGDGTVVAIANEMPRPEFGFGDRPLTRISIFLSVFNVHINRASVAGVIESQVYRPGLFVNAGFDKASLDNECNALCIRTAEGYKVGVVQIAGLIARRIITWVKPGQTIGAGERYGLIRFGSRMDIYLPPGCVPMVVVGQTMVGGETVLAELASADAAMRGGVQ